MRESRVAFVTLGCPKNQVDSEVMLASLAREGIATVADPRHADVAIVNTCAFIDASKQESVDAILALAGLKGEGGLRGLVVTGCLSQRYGGKLIEEIPEIDAVLGTMDTGAIASVVQGLIAGDTVARVQVSDPSNGILDQTLRAVSTLPHAPYLQISHGCDHVCAFCIIPTLRGKHRSQPLESLVAEAERLAASGAKELNLIGQDTTAWGTDLYGKPSLERLLEPLSRVEGIGWIRLLYTYPAYWSERLIDAIASLPRICPYIDMPLQHAADPILRRMRRGVTRARIEDLLARIRAAVPQIAIRTTFITGFPGETEEDFETLLSFVRAQRFERAGVFTYSHEEGTEAFRLEEDVPMRVRKERRDRLMAAQKEISLTRNRALVGTTRRVLVDAAPSRRRGTWVARSASEAPEIDGMIHVAVPGDASVALAAGEWADVLITGASAYDLYASSARGETRADVARSGATGLRDAHATKSGGEGRS